MISGKEQPFFSTVTDVAQCATLLTSEGEDQGRDRACGDLI